MITLAFLKTETSFDIPMTLVFKLPLYVFEQKFIQQPAGIFKYFQSLSYPFFIYFSLYANSLAFSSKKRLDRSFIYNGVKTSFH